LSSPSILVVSNDFCKKLIFCHHHSHMPLLSPSANLTLAHIGTDIFVFTSVLILPSPRPAVPLSHTSSSTAPPLFIARTLATSSQYLSPA
jgi:hypothetical protein